MRNPIRLKNLRVRFLPYIALGIVILVLRQPTPMGFALGMPLVVVGAGLRSWAAGHLVKTDALTTEGPYAHLRHPLYLGTLLVATGFAFVLGGLFTVAILAFVWPWFALHYFPRKERGESARLLACHGEAFTRYRDAVPALWPRWRAYHDTLRPHGSGAAVEPVALGGAPAWQLERYSDNNELGTLLAILAGSLLLVARAVWGLH
ncbi:MAG: methyltransferase [Myxococcota bacterium]